MHINSGSCPKCLAIASLFPGLAIKLWSWFVGVQAKHPEMHISCAGRGRAEQEADFKSGMSKAHFGHGSHNFNAAVDIFFLINGTANYDESLYRSCLEPNLIPGILWYGRPDAPWKELPHVEIENWPDLVHSGILKLVE